MFWLSAHDVHLYFPLKNSVTYCYKFFGKKFHSEWCETLISGVFPASLLFAVEPGKTTCNSSILLSAKINDSHALIRLTAPPTPFAPPATVPTPPIGRLFLPDVAFRRSALLAVDGGKPLRGELPGDPALCL